MTRIRAAVIRAWLAGATKQAEIAGRLDVSQGTISRVVEDIKVVGWEDSWLDVLNIAKQERAESEARIAETLQKARVISEIPGLNSRQGSDGPHD